MKLLVLLTSLILVSNFVLADCLPEKGKRQFNRCIACHSVNQGEHKMGPSLHGIIGRQIATQKKFNYSPAMKSKDFIWDDKMLSQFLLSPVNVVPGTVMPFSGIKKQKQRDAIICYLNSLITKSNNKKTIKKQ